MIFSGLKGQDSFGYKLHFFVEELQPIAGA